MKKLLFCVFVLFLFACQSNSETEKYQTRHDRIVDVRKKIRPVDFGDNVLLSGSTFLYPFGQYLIVLDARSTDHWVHFYDKKTFQYITSAIRKGRGPGEVVTGTFLEINEPKGVFYLSDFGNLSIYSYNVDSLVANPLHRPSVVSGMDARRLPVEYTYFNDTLSMGILLEAIGNSDFTMMLSKVNFQTGEIVPMSYKHPDIVKKRIAYAASKEHGLMVEAYNYHDLITLYDLDGNLRYNIYGPDWNTRESKEMLYFRRVIFVGDKMIVSFSGEERVRERKFIFPTRLLVFELNGDYVKTLETHYPIDYFCYDKEYNRLIMTLDAEMQFAYLDLDGLLD
jgi:hypothetical protein